MAEQNHQQFILFLKPWCRSVVMFVDDFSLAKPRETGPEGRFVLIYTKTKEKRAIDAKSKKNDA